MAELRDFTAITSWEELAEVATIDEVLKTMQNREVQKKRNREKSAKERAILAYYREHPDEFEGVS